MKLTASEIKEQDFSGSIKGYSKIEVDDFLEEVAEQYEALYRENAIIKDKVAALTEKLEHYAKIEATIQNTLLLAQNAAEQAKDSAQREADLIVRNANDSAQKILEKAHTDVITINNDFDRMKQEFVKFKARFRNFVKAQLDTFDDTEADFAKEYNVGAVVEENKDRVELEENTIFDMKNIEDHSFNNEELNEIKRFFVKE